MQKKSTACRITTIKQIHILSIVLIAITVIGVTLDIVLLWADFARGCIDGCKSVGDSAVSESTTGGQFLLEFIGFISVLVFLASFVRLWVKYIGVMGAVNKGKIFSEAFEKRIWAIGTSMLLIYVSRWGVQLLFHETEGPRCLFACVGIGMLIVSKIFALGRKMKEDQEFMV